MFKVSRLLVTWPWTKILLNTTSRNTRTRAASPCPTAEEMQRGGNQGKELPMDVEDPKKQITKSNKTETVLSEYLRVNPNLLDSVSSASHRLFLQEEGLGAFVGLDWQLQDYDMRDLHEVVVNYDEETMKSRWHNRVIDMSDKELGKIFPLPSSAAKVKIRGTRRKSNYFPAQSLTDDGYILSDCNDEVIRERLKFLCEALHVKRIPRHAIAQYMVELLEETTKKNWFGYFLIGFRKELKKGKLDGDQIMLGSHLRLILASQVRATIIEESKRMDAMATLVKCEKVEGAASRVRGKELTDVTISVPELTRTLYRLKLQENPRSESKNHYPIRDKLDCDNWSKGLVMNDLRTSLEIMERELVEKEKQKLENQKKLLIENGLLTAWELLEKEKEKLEKEQKILINSLSK